MSNAMFLDDVEVAQLTGKKRHDAQARALTFMGIEHKMRPDGSLAVLRAHVERILGEGASPKKQRKVEPRFDLLK